MIVNMHDDQINQKIVVINLNYVHYRPFLCFYESFFEQFYDA